MYLKVFSEAVWVAVKLVWYEKDLWYEITLFNIAQWTICYKKSNTAVCSFDWVKVETDKGHCICIISNVLLPHWTGMFWTVFFFFFQKGCDDGHTRRSWQRLWLLSAQLKGSFFIQISDSPALLNRHRTWSFQEHIFIRSLILSWTMNKCTVCFYSVHCPL